MRIKKFEQTIAMPEGAELAVDGRTVSVTGSAGTATKEFKMPRFIFSKDGNALKLTCENYGVYDKRNFHTIQAHVKNLIKGAQEGYTYLLKICSSHFPMNVSVSGNKFVVKNLFGEKVPRELVLKEGAKVEIKDTVVEVTGVNLELVSQVAADIEQLTRITNRDRRIFQDGIYITHKAGVPV